MGTRGIKPGSKLVMTLTGKKYYLKVGDTVQVPHQRGRELSSYQWVDGVVVYLHPALRYAVVELDFGITPAGRFGPDFVRKIRETYYMEEICKKGSKKDESC